jgi:hypothetical protein
MADNNSLQVTAPALVLNGQTINSGVNFDLGLPNLTDLINSSFAFVNAGNSGNQAFLSSVISQSQANTAGFIAQAAPLYSNIADAASQNAQAAIAAENTASANASRGGGGLCFITTAVCERDGLPDDCDTLQTLRGFRDSYMMRTNRLRNLVKIYYVIAPVILARLNDMPDYTRQVTYAILREYIESCVTCIRIGDDDGACFLYIEMLEYVAGVVK